MVELETKKRDSEIEKRKGEILRKEVEEKKLKERK